MAVLGGLCGLAYVSPADSRKYYPSYVTAIYFIGIALVCCNIHMVTRRCPRQPGRMRDQRPIYFTNDAYSDPAIVAALFWFRAVLVIAPALAAAIFRVRFPALAVGTTLTTLPTPLSSSGPRSSKRRRSRDDPACRCRVRRRSSCCRRRS